MKETLFIVFGILFISVVGEPVSPSPWRTPLGRNPQPRVMAHSGLTVVDPPKFTPPPPRSSRRGGPLPGYLPLRPVPQSRNSRWFSHETAPKPSYSRPPPHYERYPPFWSDDAHKSHSHKSRKHHGPPSFRHAKKDCNPCNSVPWVPIFKSPVGLSSDHHPRELVPHVEVYPESSIQQPTLLLPQVGDPQITPIDSSVSTDLSPPVIPDPSQSLTGFPIGNVPVAPDLLLPPQQPVPFPELSSVPVAPIHQHIQFTPDPQGLVPPVPPKTSNVVVTISEPEIAPDQDQHYVTNDQHSESSSFVDSHSPQHHNVYQHQHQNQGFDIVKSIPLAEYTSSIEHPFHIIQSAPFIDINPTFNYTQQPNFHQTYEKPPQTGSQKVSDYILGISQDSESKKLLADSSPAASKDSTLLIASAETTKVPRQESIFKDHLDPNILTPPPLPPQLTQLLPTLDTAFLHPLFPVENRGIASVVNGALLPPPVPQPMNPTSIHPPYSTIPPKKIQIIIPYTTNNNDFDQNALGSGIQSVNTTVPVTQRTWAPIVVTESAMNQPRKVPSTQDFNDFQNSNWKGDQASESNQVKHIIATNIRDLLKKEMEQKPEQNIRLQKNIDNWTALEYSNHKIVGKKEPKEVITHAKAVTSIPGTSISHLLLPSKKIPDGYFTTVSPSDFDEPITTQFPSSGVSVNSKPFTTVTRYSTVTRSGPTQRSTRIIVNYPSTTSRPEYENEIPEETTPGQNWSDLKVSIAPGTNEKVYVVTPVSNWTTGKRSTRHIDTTEKYSPTKGSNGLFIHVTEKTASTTTSTTTSAPTTEIFTKLEKVNNIHTEEKHKTKNKLYPKSTPLFRVKGNTTRYEKISKFNKPKPIEKFFATTTKPLVQDAVSSTVKGTTEEPFITSTTVQTLIFPFRNGGELPLEMAQVNFSASQLTFKNTGERKTLIKQVKVNNRRGKESNRSTSRLNLRTSTESSDFESSTGTTKLPGNLQVDVVFPHKSTAVKKGDLKKATVYGQKKLLQKPVEKTGEKPVINVNEPNISENDREDINKLTSEKPVIKPHEPNISEDDREDINKLTSDQEKNETLVAVETGMPKGVFGATRPDNSSRSLLDTIKLLRDFLTDMSEEEESQEKSQQLGKVIEKIDAGNSNRTEKELYKYNFPEFLSSELNLSKDEMNLIEGAMVELRKNKTRKKSEATLIHS